MSEIIAKCRCGRELIRGMFCSACGEFPANCDCALVKRVAVRPELTEGSRA